MSNDRIAAPIRSLEGIVGKTNEAVSKFTCCEGNTVGRIWALRAPKVVFISQTDMKTVGFVAKNAPSINFISFARGMTLGELGETLGPDLGESLEDALISQDASEMAAVGAEISAACTTIGWTEGN